MRITTLALTAALAVSIPIATAAAQYANNDRHGGVVIKGGLSFGDVSNSGALPGDVDRRDGLALGIGFIPGGPVGIGVEALYVQRGLEGDPGSARELDYIDIPLYLRLAASNRSAEPYVYVGPQLSIELSCDADGSDCPSGRSRTTFAGIIGAGLRFPSLAGISIEGRYVYGLSDLDLSTISDSESYRTRSFMVLLGIGF